MNEWLSILDIEQQTGIPNPTIRRYIRTHGHHLHIQKRHKGYMVAAGSVPLLMQIRDCYGGGMSTDEVEAELARTGAPITITVDDDDDHQVTVSASEAFADLRRGMMEAMTVMTAEITGRVREELRQEFEMQNKALLSEIESLKQALVERDQRTSELIREVQSAQQEAAATAAMTERERNERITNDMNERDRKLTEVLRNLQELKAQQATEKKRRWPWSR